MLDTTIAAVLITAAVSMGGSWLVARSSARTVDQQMRDSDRRRIVALEARVDVLETARRADAVVISRLGDHIDVLEDHIWKRLPPPPPQRPDGI